MRSNSISSVIITLIVLVVLDIFTSAIIPAFGPSNFRPAFNILIILFLSFKIDSPILAIFILVIQLTHSVFSIEGWAHGTVAGVTLSFIIVYLKEMLDFNSAISTIVVTQIFQTVWFIIVSILIYLRTENTGFIIDRFWWFLPESLLLSGISPWFYYFLERVWKVKSEGLGAES